jgi:hypothetical protein
MPLLRLLASSHHVTQDVTTSRCVRFKGFLAHTDDSRPDVETGAENDAIGIKKCRRCYAQLRALERIAQFRVSGVLGGER